VNADDLGSTAAVNHRVFELMSKRAITSASIMGNGPCVDQAISGARAHSDSSFGVHLNISDFWPLSDPGPLQPILDADGAFLLGAVRRVPLTKKLVRGIESEFEHQIAYLRDHGVSVSHIDSHHHVHTIPRLFPVLKAVQRRHGIVRVRITRNLYEHPAASVTMLKKRLWSVALRYFPRTRATEIFTEMETFVKMANRLRAPLLIELSVHPGNPDFQAEDRLLDTDWWSEIPVNIELISYNEI
jgi:predicted glycoside hydrolase/deacetylase ChbG (UPF0249 family)